MDLSHIKPFIEATHQVFETMLDCVPQRGKVRPGDRRNGTPHRTALIGLSGTVRGAVAIRFPADTAVNASRRLMQADGEVGDADIADALGEIANMVSGCAKAKIDGQDISISLPTVVGGDAYHLEHPRGSVTLDVPFGSPLGEFTVSVTLSSTDSQ